MPSIKIQQRSNLYNHAKALGLKVNWRMPTIDFQNAIDNYKRLKVKTIIKAYRNSVYFNDISTLKMINKTEGKIKIKLDRFEKLRSKIVSPADKKLLLHFLNPNGSTIITYHLQGRYTNIKNLYMTEENKFKSGDDDDLNIIPSNDLQLEWVKNPPRSKSEKKNFFRYLTKANYNLEEFQVYSNDFISEEDKNGFNPETDADIKGSNYPCFLFALLKAGVNVNIVNQISQTMFNNGATIDFIKKTANSFNLYISVKQYCVKKGTSRAHNTTSFYGTKSDNVIYLGSVGEHLFAIKPTNITKASLDKPELVEEHNRTDFIIVNKGHISFNDKKIRFLDSYEVISYLYHHRETHLEVITQQNMPFLLNNKFQEVRELNEHDFSDNHFKEMGLGEEKKNYNFGKAPFTTFDEKTKKTYDDTTFNVVYFDFETHPNNENNHVPYCISYMIGKASIVQGEYFLPTFEETKNIYGSDCELKFLEALPKNSKNLLWAHNAGFDCRFLFKHMSFSSKSTNMIDCGTKVKQALGFYQGKEIIIKDTYSFIAASLSKLPQMFNSEVEKECFPHHLVCEDNIDTLWDMNYLEDYEEKDTLISNASNINAIVDNKFDCKKYAIHYCNRDVDVLANCFEEFRKLIIEKFSLDVYRFLSISSIALAFQKNEGCFDDCYEMNSVLLGFTREGVVGGRVMTRDNQKFHILHKLADLDATSLYPSAMSKLQGFVKGKAKLFKDKIPLDADHYVAKVVINSIGIKRHFPLQSFKQNESRNFTNDLVGKSIIVGKRALEDLVEFQKATFSVIEGLYWNEGFNNKIIDTIQGIFNERLYYKKKGNPLQNILKIMMNSSYGKLLMKPIVKQKVFVSGGQEKIDEYTQKNIHKLISRTPISENLALFEEHKSIINHFSPVHLGIQILDESKHIMNKTMCLAEDINADIWYQDTDSMHIDYDKVDKLAKAYKEKYNEKLIGNKMGQFHIDFDLKGAEGEIYAIESIFLGKKSYLDILACNGNDVQGFHIRMKGIPSKLLQKDTYENYIKLFNGEEISFDLSELCSININSKTQVISKRLNFIRKVSFTTLGSLKGSIAPRSLTE